MSRRLSPPRPVRTAITSARIETAVSTGVRAPTSSPHGAWILAIACVVEPRLAQPLDPPLLGAAAAERAHVAGAGGERRDQRRLVELRVVGEDQHHVARPELPALQVAVRPVHHHLGDLREARAVDEGLAGVADRDLVADLAGELRHLGGEVDRPEDHHARLGREGLDVHRQVRAHHLAARAVAADAREPLVELPARVALDGAVEQVGHAEPADHAVVEDRHLGPGALALEQRGQRDRLVRPPARAATASSASRALVALLVHEDPTVPPHIRPTPAASSSEMP